MGCHYCLHDLADLFKNSAFFGENRNNLNATVMISLVILIVGVPFTCAIFILQHEGRNIYFDLQRQVFSGHLSVPDFIRNLPFIGKNISYTQQLTQTLIVLFKILQLGYKAI